MADTLKFADACKTGIGDIASLPHRLKTPEVLGLARYSAATLRRRQKQGRFPRPIEPGFYGRDAVLEALGLPVPRIISAHD